MFYWLNQMPPARLRRPADRTSSAAQLRLAVDRSSGMGTEMADAMQTPDGAWRVEVVRRGRTHWYRIVHRDNQLDC
jgi:hypothetical protein